MKFFHFSLSLTISLILLISVFCFFKSSLMLSIHVFRCLPLLLSPSTWPRRAEFAILFSSILSTCPNQPSLLFRIFSINVSVTPNSLLVTSFLIFSLLLLPLILLNQFISATSNLLSSSFFKHQVSDPYSNTGSTNAWYIFILVLIDIFFAFHILFNPPNAAHASPHLRLISSVHPPSSVSVPPKYTNFVTCSSTLFSIFTSMSSWCFPIIMVFVFSTFILSPILLLLSSTLFVSSCSFL